MKKIKRGDKIEINNVLYLVVGIYNNGRISEYGLLHLNTYTIGYTDKTITGLIDTYENCT